MKGVQKSIFYFKGLKSFILEQDEKEKKTSIQPFIGHVIDWDGGSKIYSAFKAAGVWWNENWQVHKLN